MDEDGNGGECLQVEPGHPIHEHTAFGDYEVYADSDTENVCLAGDNAVSETEFEQMETAWYNIHHGVGLDIHGNAADVSTFNHMLADGMQHSATFRHTMEEIGNDTAHTERVDLGNNQPDTIVDNFATNAVDLADISQFASAPRAGHHNEITRTEVLEHVLEERHYAQTHDPNDFDTAHQHGIDGQNRVRDELGQSHVQSQNFTRTADGSVAIDSHFADGQDEMIQIDDLHHGNITSVTPPGDR